MKDKGYSVLFFEKSHIIINWEGRKAFDLLDFLFKDRLHSLVDSGALSLFTLKATKPQTLLLYQGENLVCKGEPGKVAIKLLNKVIFFLTKKTTDGPLFHAAALSRNGRSILIPGESGAGKTFLAACLADNGYSYLTDEMTLVESENYCLNGFYKPLHIKNPSAFENQIGLQTSCRNGNGGLPVEKGFLTNCFYVNSSTRCRNTKAAMIIFPKYERGKKFDVKRLTCANTGFLLMKSLINSENLTSHGFHEISMFSREIPAYSMTYGSSSRVVQEVDSLLSR